MTSVKPVEWVGSSHKDLVTFPEEVLYDIGFDLYAAQTGTKGRNAKPLRGFGGAGVLEIVANHNGNTFRAVYTVRFEDAIYVLHVFQKKSKSGISTPHKELETIKQRLRIAQELHKTWQAKQKRKV